MAKKRTGKPTVHKVVVTASGERFSSEREHQRWSELLEMERNGLIYGLRRNEAYELLPDIFEDITVQMKTKVKEQRVLLFKKTEFVAHFVYEEDGIEKAEYVMDSRKISDEIYFMMKKLMYFVHNIKLKEIE